MTLWSPPPPTIAVNATVSAGNTVTADGNTRRRLTTLNGTGVISVPRGVAMVTGPVVAASGTTATTADGVMLAICAAMPLKETDVTPALNPVPTKLISSPAPPSCGKNP